MPDQPVLHMLCGKAAAGKTTLAARLAAAPATILVSQDRWMAALYPDELNTPHDHGRYGPRLREAMEPHLVDLLRLRVSVVLDWPANTIAARAWLRALAAQGRARCELHWLDAPDALCRERLARRHRAGQHHPSAATRFEPPTAVECANLTVYPTPAQADARTDNGKRLSPAAAR